MHCLKKTSLRTEVTELTKTAPNTASIEQNLDAFRLQLGITLLVSSRDFAKTP